MGTPDFAVPSLDAVAAAGHEIACVYCQPPRPAGRGQAARPSPVQQRAEQAGWPLRMPVSLKDGTVQAAFAALRLDAAVVVAYGLLLPEAVLQAPRLGCLNVHASLLPRWRGAAPIQRAILAGDTETGVTIMQVDEGLDSGPILSQSAVPIEPTTTAADLHDTLAALGAEMIVAALDGLDRGVIRPEPQPALGVTYAKKLRRDEAVLDWRRKAVDLERQVRAFAPWPGAYTELPGRDGGERLKVLAATVVPVSPQAGAAPGTVVDGGLTVACGEGALRLLRVQRAGKAPMDAEAFLRGFPIDAGLRLAVR